MGISLSIGFVYAQTTYERGTVFLSDVGGGNITFAQNITANTFSNAVGNQARFTNFTMLANGSWANIGFRNQNGNNTMNITGVDTRYVRFDSVINNNTVLEFYSPDLGEPDFVTGGNGTVWIAPTLFITMNVSQTVILEWGENITLVSLTASDSRIGINVTITIDANITYANGTAFTSQPVFIQSVNATHQGSGIWRINQTQIIPGVYNYTNIQTIEGNLTGNLSVIWDLFNLDVGALYTEIEVNLNTLIYVNGSSVVDGHQLGPGDTASINGVTLTWNTYMSRLEGTVSRNVPVIESFNTLNSFSEATYGVNAGNITSFPTVTWTTSSLTQILPFLRTGDWPGVILQINYILLGETLFWTLLLSGLSLAIYNYSGAETAILAWILGWGLFSPVIHGEAVTISLIMIALAGGIYIAKFFLDRRTSV